MQKYSGNIVPENGEEELLMMAGRVNALEAYLNCTDFINKESVAAILGLQLKTQDEKDADNLEKRGLLKITDIKQNN